MIFQVRCQLTSYTLQSSPWVCSITVPFYRPGKKWLERLTWSWASYFNPDLYHPKSWVFLLFFSACAESTHYSKSSFNYQLLHKSFPALTNQKLWRRIQIASYLHYSYGPNLFVYSDLYKCFLFPCTQVCWGQGFQLVMYFVNSGCLIYCFKWILSVNISFSKYGSFFIFYFINWYCPSPKGPQFNSVNIYCLYSLFRLFFHLQVCGGVKREGWGTDTFIQTFKHLLKVFIQPSLQIFIFLNC